MKEFATKEELFRYVKDNRDILIAEKKSATKTGDTVVFGAEVERRLDATKGENGLSETANLKVKAVINTTNLFDSHYDVHIPGLWNKTLKDRRKTYHLQEHKMKFDHIITDKVTPSVRMMKWSDLGCGFDGQTQALIFDSEIEKSRNEYMYDQYMKGYVDNHSVGMQYVTLFMCINSEDRYYHEEKENWDKYYPQVANKKDVDEVGFFWAVTEAKLIEGSAVPIGSNYATPTLSVKEPSEDTLDSRKSTINIEDFKQEFTNKLKQLWTKN